ncbi:hypothetical protein SBOR_9038 [Sclerotinia borealis F-4128]|uniref:Uncharacterized protein n=1 Tax=Sclerotinia borealis (strain F-4128) TaxID=1432307 RepID=W9C7K7_SCLBF|nr:hypothetical protein SBOR_9038 [Sclerotinia borealis F-4128]
MKPPHDRHKEPSNIRDTIVEEVDPLGSLRDLVLNHRLNILSLLLFVILPFNIFHRPAAEVVCLAFFQNDVSMFALDMTDYGISANQEHLYQQAVSSRGHKTTYNQRHSLSHVESSSWSASPLSPLKPEAIRAMLGLRRSGVHKTEPQTSCSKICLGVVRLGTSNAPSTGARETKCVMEQNIGSSTSVEKNIVLQVSVSSIWGHGAVNQLKVGASLISSVVVHCDLQHEHVPPFAIRAAYNQQARILIVDRITMLKVLFKTTSSIDAVQSTITLIHSMNLVIVKIIVL